MADILIRRRHALSVRAARRAAEQVASQLGEEFELSYEWDENVLLFRRSGVSGELAVKKGEVSIQVRLGMLLTVIRPRIESEIHRYFDENFGADGGRRK
ncbi:MAG TPA: polyhydroxyalkanoic acid system family protein [Candidatus Desulfobacillus sp.]|nr:polyhydroxyalkanoic acid system family protein [Candidatus Desulfobacillus sp.]